MNKQIYRFLACSLVASTLLVSSSSASEVTDSLSIMPNKKVSLYAANRISQEASRATISLANARGDINRGDLSSAKIALKNVIFRLNIIDTLRPTDTIKNHITIAKKHLNYESAQEVKEDLVPIALEVSKMKFKVPTQDVEKHLAKAKIALNANDKSKAKKELTKTMQAVSATAVYMPVDETKAYTYSALSQLSLGNTEAADKILKKAEDSLVIISTVEIAPMQKAKKSYYQAMKDYAHGDYAKAKKDLQDSELWLDKVSHSSDTKAKKEVQNLKERTNALKNSLSKSTDNADAKLHALWADSKALSEKTADSISTHYHATKALMQTKTNLLDAKLHLEYAKTKQFILKSKNGTKEELQKSKDALRRASKSADAKTKQSIQDLGKGIDVLEEETNKTSDAIKIKYQDVKKEMDNTIHKL